MSNKKLYTPPLVLVHQPIRFETAHSWNKGHGNRPDGNGNDGIHYPNDPYTGPQQDDLGGKGNPDKKGIILGS